MNDITKKNDPAHPLVFKPEMIKDRQHVHLGISKREYFAALAMQAMCNFDLGQENSIAKEYARRSVIMADALIEALNK